MARDGDTLLQPHWIESQKILFVSVLRLKSSSSQTVRILLVANWTDFTQGIVVLSLYWLYDQERNLQALQLANEERRRDRLSRTGAPHNQRVFTQIFLRDRMPSTYSIRVLNIGAKG